MDEDNEPRKKVAHEVGMPLDDLSIEELGHRIELLSSEIERLRADIERKKSSRDAAESVFKI